MWQLELDAADDALILLDQVTDLLLSQATREHNDRRYKQLPELDRAARALRAAVLVLLDPPPGGIEELWKVIANPSPAASFEWRHVARARNAVQTRPIGQAAEGLEAVGAFVSVISRLAASGNVEAASRAADRLFALLIVSLEAARETRGEPRDPPVPILPLARVATDQALAALKSSTDAAIRNTMSQLLQRLSGLGQEHEGLAMIVAARFTLAYDVGDDVGLQINVLWETACRAIDVSDSTALGLSSPA